jgi:activating signal cointegrator complex subunit 3
MQVIYIAPLKAIVRERMSDWQKRLVLGLGKKMVLLFVLMKKIHKST